MPPTTSVTLCPRCTTKPATASRRASISASCVHVTAKRGRTEIRRLPYSSDGPRRQSGSARENNGRSTADGVCVEDVAGAEDVVECAEAAEDVEEADTESDFSIS